MGPRKAKTKESQIHNLRSVNIMTEVSATKALSAQNIIKTKFTKI